jgi:hypothetical protein
LKRQCDRLFFDILTVISGIRSGFLLDYGRLEASLFADLVGSISANFGLEVCIVTSGDCCILVAPKLLILQGLRFISFRTPNDTTMALPEWLPHPVQMLQRLDGVKRFLQSVVNKAGYSSNARTVQVVRANALPGCPCMPTLHGFLLGYPVIYVVHDLEEAERASRCLSTCSLRLYCLTSSLDLNFGTNLGIEDMTILCFSAPESLCNDTSDGDVDSELMMKAVLQEWLAVTTRRHSIAVEHGGVPWGALKMSQTTRMCGVAL